GHCEVGRGLVDQSMPQADEINELFTTAMQAALDGGQTLKRLLLFTRKPVAGEVETVDLGALLNEAAHLTAPRWRDTTQAEGRPVHLSVETVAAPAVQGPRSELREALTNLIFNAVDAMPHGGGLKLVATRSRDRAIVEVIDTGVGMAPDVR